MKHFISVLAVFAVLLSGCQSEYTIDQSISTTLSADVSLQLIGDNITFRLMNIDGDDLTDEATFYVDDVAIEGHTFSSSLIGSHKVRAVFKDIPSNEIQVAFHDGSEVLFAKNVLIEDYTGTWCGYCPRVAYGIELVKQQTTNVVAVGIHRASSNPADAFYDPYNYDTEELEAMIAIPGYPKGLLNRKTLWRFPEPNKVDQVLALTQGENPRVGLAIQSTRNGNNLSIDVKVKTSRNLTNAKLVVYVLENGLIYDQHNYTSYYGGVDLLLDFEHNHVLRAALTPLLGETIPDADVRQGRTYTRSFNIPMPANLTNPAKTEIVAFVTDATTNAALNVRAAETGEQQTFQEL